MCCLAEISEGVLSELIVYPVFFFCGLLFIGTSIPMVLGKIPPNEYYGWRTPKAFRDKETWYAINRYNGRDFIIMGSVQIVFNAAMLVVRCWNVQITCWMLVPGNLLILVGGTIMVMIRGCRYLRKL